MTINATMDARDRKKRKIDHGGVTLENGTACDTMPTPPAREKESTEEAPITPDDIPATVWAEVMDNLPYTDVLSCLMVNRMISFEAPKFVETLSIFKASELQVLPLYRNRRRFENVQYVEINYFVDAIKGTNEQRMNIEVVDRVVPFLESFPKLDWASISGWDDISNKRLSYDALECKSPTDHNAHYRRLVEHIGDAYRRHSLPKLSWCFEILEEGQHSPILTGAKLPPENEDEPCSFCRKACSSFPLFGLKDLISGSNVCISNSDIEQIIKERNWSVEELADSSSFFGYNSIFSGLSRTSLIGETHLALQEKLKTSGAVDPKYLYFITENMLKRAECLWAIGGRVKMDVTLTRDVLLEQMFDDPYSNDVPRGKHALTLTTFQRLIGIGYPFNENDFVIVDPSCEASLHETDLVTYQWPMAI